MISFTPFDSESANEISAALSKDLIPECADTVREIILSTLESDVECAACISDGCLLLRIFDYGRYYFAYPYEICEDADVSSAVDSIVEYAMREELELVFTDVPSEALGALLPAFRHADIDAEDVSASSYRVRVKTECQLMSELPSFSSGELTVNALTEEDIAAYALLCRLPESNEFWSYDYREDCPDPDDRYFFDTANFEFLSGTAFSLAVRWCGKLVGEIQLYSFDGRGCAHLAIRVLPQLWGRGIGKRAVWAAKEIAKGIGLTRLYTEVFRENERSVGMLSGVGDIIEESAELIKFSINLTD